MDAEMGPILAGTTWTAPWQGSFSDGIGVDTQRDPFPGSILGEKK